MEQCLIFDLDRTLIDSTEISDLMLSDIERNMGVNPSKLDAKMKWSYTFGEYIKDLANSGNCDFNELFEYYKRRELEMYCKKRILGRDSLIRLKEKGCKICILTNNSINSIKGVLSNRYNSALNFDMMLAFEDLLSNEDKDANIKRVMQRFGSGITYYYIGDHIRDVMFAKKAGAIPIGITTGGFGRKELKDVGADFVIRRISEIEKIVLN